MGIHQKRFNKAHFANFGDDTQGLRRENREKKVYRNHLHKSIYHNVSSWCDYKPSCIASFFEEESF